MPLRYTGRAAELRHPNHPDKVYKPGDIVPLTQNEALNLIEQSKMHTFEIVKDGKEVGDLEETVTSPDTSAAKKEAK